jgi:hypothetical protein
MIRFGPHNHKITDALAPHTTSILAIFATRRVVYAITPTSRQFASGSELRLQDTARVIGTGLVLPLGRAGSSCAPVAGAGLGA